MVEVAVVPLELLIVVELLDGDEGLVLVNEVVS